MQDPSQGVAQQLQPHVHLVSLHRFPVVQTLNVDQAFRYLLDAPSIVKQIAPMSWNYVQAPQDGTVWLEWIPLHKNDQPYASDGYVWGDPEQSYRQEFGGYTIELKMHMFGYRPGMDQMATHARTRYHFVSKNPSVNAPPPDPSLWIVHYHSANQQQWLPAAQLPISTQMQHIMGQRRWLESQGRLDRKDFMLHDREHWPTLHVPGTMQPQGQYGGVSVQNRFPQQHAAQAGGPPAAKRPRTQGPGMPMPGSSDGAPDISIEIEEDTALGDFFDHLTQRDISVARYSQHHRWMEEVFSSPYATSQIVPPDLGLGLMGELKGLTDGILDLPSTDFKEAGEKPKKPQDAPPFTNLKKEQVEEFGKRVQNYLEEGQAELERMKAEHAAKMQEWKKTKSLMQAEKRLRYATWESHENAVPVFRLDVPQTNGQTEDSHGNETVDDITKEVEHLLKVKIAPAEGAKRIARGGFKERKEPEYSSNQQNMPQDDSVGGLINDTQNNSTAASTPGANGMPAMSINGPADAAPESDEQQMQKAPATNAPFPPPTSNQPTPDQIGADQVMQGQGTQGQSNTDMPGVDMNDTLMDDMDMDVGNDMIDFGDDNAEDMNQEAVSAPPPADLVAPSPGPDASTTQPSAAGSSSNIGQENTQQETAGLTDNNAFGDNMGDAGDSGMFNDNTFDDLLNPDGSNDLVSFGDETDGMGLDNSFGDALHGMEDSAAGSGTPATTVNE